MTNHNKRSKDAANLRQKAEALARERATRTPEDNAALSSEETRRTLHELRVQQIELEIQNEELRAAQTEIAAGRARYFDLYDLAPVGYCTLSEEGLILEANLAAATLLGTARGALVKQSITRFIFKADQDTYYLHRKQLIQTGKPQECELRLAEKPDDTPFWVHLTATAAQAEDGAPVCRVVLSDITERKQAEEASRAARSRLQATLDAVPDLLFEVDAEGRIFSHHTHRSNLLAVPPGVFTAKRIADVLPPDAASACQHAIDEAAQNGFSHGLTYPLAMPQGERWYELSVAPMDAAAQPDQRFIMICRDITERKRAEAALRESEQRLEAIIDAAPFGAHQYELLEDGQLVFIGFNASAERILGTSQVPFLGKTIEGAFPGLIGTAIPDEYRKVAATGIPYQIEQVVYENENIKGAFDVRCVSLGGRRMVAFFQDITERKKAEAALRESEERFHRLFERAPLGYQSLDSDGRFIEVNQAWLDTLGYKRDEVMGKWFGEFLAPEYVQAFRERFPVFKVRGEVHSEFHMMHKDGTRRYIAFDGRIGHNADGSFRQTHCILRDDTERKRVEDQLLLQSQIIDNSPIIAAYHDTDLNMVWANRAYQKATGLSLEQIRGRKCYEVWNLSKSCRDCPVITAIETGEGAVHELTPDNQDHWPESQGCWQSHAAPVRDEQGAVIGAIEFALDITERKQSEAYREMGLEILQILNDSGDLRESIQRVLAVLRSRTRADAVGMRLQEGEDFPYFAVDGFPPGFLQTENTLVERGKDGGVCRDKDGKVRLECTCGLVISGKTDPSNLLFTKGGSCWTNDSFPLLDLPSDQDPRLHPRSNCIHQGYASLALIPLRTKDRIFGLLQLNDKRKGRFTRETTEILEGIAAHIASALMRKQGEKEREVLQSQLTQAQKMESVGRLAGGVAHDFNNLLMGMMSYVELCRESIADDHPIREWLDEITNQGTRTADLTRQLLAFARKQTIAPKVIDLNDMVVAMLKMLRRLIGEDIDLSWQPGAELWPVKLDPGQVDQILVNLCANARDAIMGVGKVTIGTQNVSIGADYCREHAEAAIGAYVMLTISDDGCGMDKETLAHLFEPFFTTKDVGKGSGLGLATVYGIVKQNLGFVDVCSEPRKGTTFRVYLPRSACEETRQAEALQPTKPVGGTETILLVEDEKGVRVPIALFLERQGYTVLAADSPAAALRLAEEHPGAIHLLITDVVMPGMNGHDLAAKLTEKSPRLKRLFVSGYTADVIADHGVLDEGVYFLGKPFTRDDIFRKVRGILDAD